MGFSSVGSYNTDIDPGGYLLGREGSGGYRGPQTSAGDGSSETSDMADLRCNVQGGMGGNGGYLNRSLPPKETRITCENGNNIWGIDRSGGNFRGDASENGDIGRANLVGDFKRRRSGWGKQKLRHPSSNLGRRSL